jgi:hypothetical protein
MASVGPSASVSISGKRALAVAHATGGTLSGTFALSGEERRLALANIDMRQAEAAARLLDRQVDVHVRRALETAIAVCYARPWLESNRDGKLKKRWLPNGAEELRLHDLLMDLRKRTYAHNDPTGGRRSLATLEAGVVTATGEEWIPLPRKDLDPIAELCARQAKRFQAGLADMLGEGN